jgi:hypothetical protein
MDRLTESVVTICVAIIGLATLAVLVGKNAQTSNVIKSAGGAFTSALGVAVSPVTNGGGMGNYSLPNGGL